MHESGNAHWRLQVGASQASAPLHVSAAPHTILHLLPAHWIRCLQDPAPVQATSQALALVQSIGAVHEPPPVQTTRQGRPSGQTMKSVQLPTPTHAIVQVPEESHVPIPASAHRAGHSRTASTIAASGPAPTASVGASTAASNGTEPSTESEASGASGPESNDTSGKEQAANTTRPMLAATAQHR